MVQRLCLGMLLYSLALGFLTLTVYQAYTFPSEASCEDINAFPNNEDIQKAMESRSQFLKECLYLQNQCNVRRYSNGENKGELTGEEYAPVIALWSTAESAIQNAAAREDGGDADLLEELVSVLH